MPVSQQTLKLRTAARSIVGFDKTKDFRIAGVTNQNATVRMPIGDSSGGTFTRIVNPLRGTLFWDQCMYVLQGVSVAGGATGGSYTIQIDTDALTGYTGLPIAKTVVTLGPLSKKTQILDNLHKSPSSALPTHVTVTQTATGGGIWFQLTALAKQYRGVLSTPGTKTSERIIQGNMLRGTSSGGQFGDDKGIAASTTFTLGTTGSDLGLGKMRLWDSFCAWVVSGNSLSGTHDINIVSKVGGNTVIVATTGDGGGLSAAGQRLAIGNSFYGQIPNPTQIIWRVVSAGGVSDARIVILAKSGRGSMGKE